MGVHPFVLWTARLCAGCYLARYLADAVPAKSAARGFWACGALLLAVHTAAAFHFVHDWSHSAAVQQTAEQTEAVMGFHWGGGVWFNYAAVAIWGADALLSFRGPRTGAKRAVPHGWSIFVHLYLAVMMICATVVFGPSWWWGVAAAFGVAWLLLMLLRRRKRHESRPRLSD